MTRERVLQELTFDDRVVAVYYRNPGAYHPDDFTRMTLRLREGARRRAIGTVEQQVARPCRRTLVSDRAGPGVRKATRAAPEPPRTHPRRPRRSPEPWIAVGPVARYAPHRHGEEAVR